jgi:very-short-patch-repair endonuclease
MKTEIDRLARAWAEQHYGVFRRTWAADAGATPAVMRNRIANGAWTPVGAEGLLIAGAPLTWHARMQAAVWDGGEGALLSGACAARLHRFPGFYDDYVEILVRKSLDHVCTIARVRESRRFDRVRSTERDRLPVVAPEDTVVHLAPQLGVKRLDWLVDEIVLGKKAKLPLLFKAFDQLSPHCRGMTGLRAVLRDRTPGEPILESQLERQFLDFATARRLPPFQRQVHIEGRDRRPGRVDFLWPDVMLIVEVDGRRWHARQADFERDSRRRLAMRARGYSTVVVTWLMLTQEPDETYADLLAARTVVA